MDTIIPLLTRKEYAKEHGIEEATVFYQIKRGDVSRITFTWYDKNGKKYTNKFILPKRYAIIDREALMAVVKWKTL